MIPGENPRWELGPSTRQGAQVLGLSCCWGSQGCGQPRGARASLHTGRAYRWLTARVRPWRGGPGSCTAMSFPPRWGREGLYLGCLSSGCYNKLPLSRWLINNRHLFPTVLEAGSPRSGRSVVRFWVRALFLVCRRLAACSLCPHMAKGKGPADHRSAGCRALRGA